MEIFVTNTTVFPYKSDSERIWLNFDKKTAWV